MVTNRIIFFATSVSGGSETTYWCDYNWDNTDTSEHCLLIGGDSDNGGEAGLFNLYSDNGVSYSDAYIGSMKLRIIIFSVYHIIANY